MSGAGNVVSSQGGANAQTAGGTLRAAPGGQVQDVSNVGQQGADSAQQTQQTQQQPGDQQQQPQQPTEQPAPGSFEAKAKPFTDEFQKNGTLSADSIKKAAQEFGVPEAVVQQYLAGAQQQQQANTASIDAGVKVAHEAVGGEQQWKAFAAWANSNLSEGDMKTLVDAVNGGAEHPGVASAVIQHIYGQFKAAGGGGGPRDVSLEGGTGSQHAVEGYRSQAEMIAAMNDPRYRRDAAYNAEVAAKVAKSNFR